MKAERVTPMPFPGPRPFQLGEEKLFFGRKPETSELFSLTTAHRTVVLYAASGAGKTSLVNAGLIPALAGGGFEVLPPATVRGGMPAGTQPESLSNIYVFRTLVNWSADESGAARLSGVSLADFLKGRKHLKGKDGLPSPRVLIFDQFEEVFTLHLERWKERTGFFGQVQTALDDDPLLRVVFALREDYIAQLEPYGKIVPLRTRFRLERLDAENALEAITEPLAATPKRFAPGVAEKLRDNLLMIRVETEGGNIVEVPGEFIEPVQLQVCCDTLWRQLPDSDTIITEKHLQALGDVDRALSAFYDDAIRAVCDKTQTAEENVRTWCETKLITSMGTRGTVYREAETTGGIPNDCVVELESKHLIRAEYRAGAHWYELSHDRFVAPIRASNQAYLKGRMQQVSAADAEATKIFLQINMAYKEGRHDDIAALFEKAFQIYKVIDQLAALENLASAYHFAEQYDREIELLSQAIQWEPNTARLYEARGVGFWYAGKFAEAVEDFTRVLELQPGFAGALSARGQALAESGRFEAALTDLDRAISLADRDESNSMVAYARSGRGLAYGGLGAYESAFRDFDESIRSAPDNAWVYFNRALTYERMHQNDKAKADFETALNRANPKLTPWKREYASARVPMRPRKVIQ